MKIIKLILLGSLSIQGLSAIAQAPNTEMTKMLDLSRPNANHEALKQLAGTWQFHDAKLSFVKGTLVRSSKYDDRFFNVEITGGKLQVPVARGMKEGNYRGFELEGYDNVRKVFVTIAVNNHIGSDIQEETGTYDASKKQFTYEWESELLPGEKVKNRRVVTLIDANHYTEEYYEFQDSAFVKVRELDYNK